MSTIGAQQDVFSSLGLTTQQSQQAAQNNDPSEMGLDTFMKLMVTQLNNQDPFKPMENGEFLGQIAQFGSVTGLDKLNQQMSDLSASLTSGQALQAGSIVGRDVLVPANQARYEAGDTIRGQVELENPSADVTLRVYDQANQLLREMPLNGGSAGPLNFSWDGTKNDGQFAPSGQYRVAVSASYGGQETELQTELFSTVDSVNLTGQGGVTLNLAGVGLVAFNDVKQIF